MSVTSLLPDLTDTGVHRWVPATRAALMMNLMLQRKQTGSVRGTGT